MIDLQLAEYKAGKYQFNDPVEANRVLFRQPRIMSYAKSRNGLDLITTQLRHSTWRRQESHNKQLKHFLDRDRYQQNQTWQAEYDRLSSVPGPGLQPFVDARLENLKSLILK